MEKMTATRSLSRFYFYYRYITFPVSSGVSSVILVLYSGLGVAWSRGIV